VSLPCSGKSELFFAHLGTLESMALVKEAKSLCAACDLKTDCRERSIARREEYGVWGGLDEKERRTEIRRRRKGARGGTYRSADQLQATG
jgi:WhiB family redox-sensing transcriptional regulator